MFKLGRGTSGAAYGFIFRGVDEAVEKEIGHSIRARRGVWSLIAAYLAIGGSGFRGLKTLETFDFDGTPVLWVIFDQNTHLDKMFALVQLLRQSSYLRVDAKLLHKGKFMLAPPQNWKDLDPLPFPLVYLGEAGVSASFCRHVVDGFGS
jgi:hypothetical protein